MGIQHVRCYSDSLTALELVSKGGGELHHYASLIRTVRELVKLDWSVELVHTLREGNSSANFMAKMGVDLLREGNNSADFMGVFFLWFFPFPLLLLMT